jgi:hypothetical protein
MGAAWYIVAEKPELQDQIGLNGKFIGMHFDHVNAIAANNGCKRIEHYHSQRKEDLLDFIQAEMEDITDSVDPNKLPEEIWFSPVEGMQYIQKLLELTQDDSCTSRSTKIEILADLNQYLKAMRILRDNNSRWHFTVDF